MSKMYEKIKAYYDGGYWNEVRVKNMVVKNIITREEYEMITGKNINNFGIYNNLLQFRIKNNENQEE